MLILRKLSSSVFFLILLFSCSRNPATGEKFTASDLTSTPITFSSPSPTYESITTSNPSAEKTPAKTASGQTLTPVGLNPSGPYAVFESESGIWITNPDGSFPTRIAEQGVGQGEQDLHDAISPRGDRIAVVAAGKTGLDLILTDIPGGQPKTISRLLDITRNELLLNSMSPSAFAYYAITDFANVAWQPGGGNLLAYVSAEKGPTADLFAFDANAEKTLPLDENPSQAIHPIWSPDGRYLLYFGVSWLPPYGATYVTFQPMDGVWAIRVSDRHVIPQPAPKGTHQGFLGWQDDSHYLVFDSDKDCPARSLRAVDVATGNPVMIADYCFYSRPALSPSSGAILLSVDADCDCWTGEGVYLFLPGQITPIQLMKEKAFEVSWLPESNVFYAYPEALFSADGISRYNPPVRGSSYHPAISKSGRQAWEVIADHKNRVMIQAPDGHWQAVLEGNVGVMMWDPISGDTLLIALENGELLAATAPDFTPRNIGYLGVGIDQAAWILHQV